MGLGLHYRGPLVLAAVGSDGLLAHGPGVLGLGSVVTAYPDALRWLTLGGVALVLYGGAALRRAWEGEALEGAQDARRAPSPDP